jgi:hypothetical protein
MIDSDFVLPNCFPLWRETRKAPRKIAKKLSAESLAKRLRGQGSAKKPRKKAPRGQRLREKARGEGSAKTEGSRKTEGSAKAPQNLCGKLSEGSAKNVSHVRRDAVHVAQVCVNQ